LLAEKLRRVIGLDFVESKPSDQQSDATNSVVVDHQKSEPSVTSVDLTLSYNFY